MDAPRDFRLLMMAAAVAASAAAPVRAQTAQPAVATAPAASIPDFSGVWTHPYWPGFDPPLSGQGGVVNRSRLPNGGNNTRQFVGDYTNPILKPQAAEVVRQHGEISKTGVAYPTPANQCWPQPVPYIFWNLGMQMLQQPHQITFLYDKDHEVRRVRMNAAHPARVTPSWYGDSVGHYEGDTLVVDTVGVRTARPFAMADVYGTPYSEALHVVERYRMVDDEAARQAERRTEKENLRISVNDSGLIVDPSYQGKALQLQFTVEDAGVFTMPWSASITYRRAAGVWPEIVCSENPYEYYAGKSAAVPRADKPDF